MEIKLNKVQSMLDWLKIKLYLDARAISANTRVVKRGQVYKCNFGLGVGSEMQKERPSVVLQNDIGNMKSSNTIVAPITHNASKLPCMAPINPVKNEVGDLILDGQVNTSNTICVSKARLGAYICDLESKDMKKVDESLAKTVGLMGYYSKIENKLKDKKNYIERLKKDRNEAQDFISLLINELGVSNKEELKDKITVLLENVDK